MASCRLRCVYVEIIELEADFLAHDIAKRVLRTDTLVTVESALSVHVCLSERLACHLGSLRHISAPYHLAPVVAAAVERAAVVKYYAIGLFHRAVRLSGQTAAYALVTPHHVGIDGVEKGEPRRQSRATARRAEG